MATRPLILVICTGNSCRSHMAEGFLRAALGDIAEVASAGSRPAGFVHPLAVLVMAEVGVDISAHTSKNLAEFSNSDVETVITVCSNADHECPIFPGQRNRHHWPFDDPAQGGEDEFKRVRDEIRKCVDCYVDGRRDACLYI